MDIKTMIPEKSLFRVDEAAQIVRRSKRTLYRWCTDDRIRYVKVQRRGILIPRDALVEVIRLSSECYDT